MVQLSGLFDWGGGDATKETNKTEEKAEWRP